MSELAKRLERHAHWMNQYPGPDIDKVVADMREAANRIIDKDNEIDRLREEIEQLGYEIQDLIEQC